MAEQTFSVDGLHCEGCVATITTALTSLDPVSAVSIDLDTKGTSTVRITTDVELTREQVQEALDGNGSFSVIA
ncbi:hypothetical protein MSIMFI_01103 [Mycobacterium simulans]|uniref:heavy-metal-associated domain-containing protein n=1 Tax=Mycobacterium simulans TaxID=627089 RepID=UPI00174DA1C7|nr:heavy metal-associated domain-containing protein [Mycobacterium simulans]SON59619.1 hypothetical protein MSIMFI_01103 [Mycobacterium simulans]